MHNADGTMPMLDMQTIQTGQVDGVWWARLNHHILGPVDGRSATEQWAIDALLAELRKKCEKRNREEYARLCERFPNHFPERKPA